MRYLISFTVLFLVLGAYLFFELHRPTLNGLRKHSTKKRDIRVQYVSTRREFHSKLVSLHRHLDKISDLTDMVICEPKYNRTVGAFVYMNYEQLQRNKAFMKEGVVSRDAKSRAAYGAPNMDLVKDQVVDTGSGKMSLWHLTHLIAFRHSLSEGDFKGLLFAGTAHLNMGARYDLNYIPPYRGTNDAVQSRVNWLKEYFFKHGGKIQLEYPTVNTSINFGSRGAAQFSLNDFELLFDFFVNWKKDHVFKYGVECFYEDGAKIPTDVNVVIIDVTEHKRLVDVILANKL